MGSPLFFGSAVDEGCSILLEGGSLEDAKNKFDVTFEYFHYNGGKHFLPTGTDIRYYSSDFDTRLLTDGDRRKIEQVFPEVVGINLDEFHRDYKDGSTEIEDAEILFNLMNWLCLRRKGHLFLEAYVEKVIPKVTKVYSIQKEIRIETEEDVLLRGFLDFHADIDGHEDVIIDNKTSSKAYSEDSILTSQQLTIYCKAEGKDTAAYVVMLKPLKWPKCCQDCGHRFTSAHRSCPSVVDGERCAGKVKTVEKPEVDIQIIIDKIDPEYTEKVFDEIKEITTKIKNKEFEQNFDACFQFGAKCPYWNLCRTGDESDLIEIPEGER